MSLIPPGRLKTVTGAADLATLTQFNFEQLSNDVYKLTPTPVSGVPNTLIGPPTTGDRILNERWVDSLGAEFVCVTAGTPGDWAQLRPAIVAADPGAGAIPVGYRIWRSDENYREKYHTGGYAWAYRDDVDGSAAAVQGNLDAHEADTGNPHAVTAVQAGADPAGSAATVQGNLDAHEADTGNPHGVTAVQAGADPAGSAATVQGNLDAHEADTGNPHAVTAVQAGADPAGSAATVQGNLDAHGADTANPHGVTAAQAGALPVAGGTMDDGADIELGEANGTRLGTAATQQLGFWGAAAIGQPSGAAQAAVALGNTNGAIGGLAISDPPTQAEVQALRDAAETLADDVRNLSVLVHALRSAAVDAGLAKGSA